MVEKRLNAIREIGAEWQADGMPVAQKSPSLSLGREGSCWFRAYLLRC